MILLASDPSPWPAVVDHALVALLTVAVPSLVTVWWGNKKRAESSREREQLSAQIKEVHDDVKTGNSLSMGQLADDAESRRVGKIPVADRTVAEAAHLVTIPEKH